MSDRFDPDALNNAIYEVIFDKKKITHFEKTAGLPSQSTLRNYIKDHKPKIEKIKKDIIAKFGYSEETQKDEIMAKCKEQYKIVPKAVTKGKKLEAESTETAKREREEVPAQPNSGIQATKVKSTDEEPAAKRTKPEAEQTLSVSAEPSTTVHAPQAPSEPKVEVSEPATSTESKAAEMEVSKSEESEVPPFIPASAISPS